MRKKTFFIFGLLTALAVAGYFIYGAFATSNPHSWTNGLVGYWSFDGQYTTSTAGTRDTSGNNNWGTFNGGVGVAGGISGQSLSFDGVDDYVDAGYSGLPSGSSNRTISFWVKPDAIPDAWGGPIWYGTTAAGQGFAIVWNNAAANFIVGRYGLNASAANNTTIPMGQWSYFAVVLSGDSNLAYYLNGSPDGTATLAGINTVLSDNEIGRIWASDGQSFDGLIDEVRIYNRALGADEVKQHYDQTRRNLVINNPSGTPPVAWWKLDEGNNSKTARDYSVNANTGTLYGEMATSTTFGWVDGQVGKALYFDGSNDYVQIPNSASLNPTTAMTLSTWFYDENTDWSTGQNPIVKPFTSHVDPYYQYHFQLHRPSNSLVFCLVLDGTRKCAGDAPLSWTQNKWNYLVGTYDGSIISLYMNGVLLDTTEASGAISSYNTPMEFSHGTPWASYTNTIYFWKGKLDDVRIYNYARTADQIAADYRAGAYRTIVGTSVPSTWWTNGLVGYWNFDGQNTTSTNGTRDTSGNNKWGTFNGGVKPVAGISGQALSFDGVNDYVSTKITQEAIHNYSAGTVEFWFKANAITYGAYNGTTASRFFIGSYDEFTVLFNSTGNKLTFVLYDGSYSLLSGTTANFALNTWYHVVVSWGSGGMKIYLNGNLENSNSDTSLPQAVSSYLLLGGTVGYFNGLMDEFRIYNRALGADEVMEHYLKTKRNIGL